jgi:polo-like kinase 1
MQTVWVSKWIDYSSKYGLGYLLSDNAAGVFFNDSTKIVVAHKDVVFYYYERRAVSQTEKQDVQTRYSFSDYPKELQKKVTLLEHFKSYLSQNKVQSSS